MSFARQTLFGQRRFFALTLALSMVGGSVLVWRSSLAAFSGNTSNPSNSWTIGAVTLQDDDNGGTHNPATGTAMFSATNVAPGSTPQTRCIRVTYAGNVQVQTAVKVYASAISDPDSIGQYLHLKIEEGTGSGAYTDGTGCSGGITGPVAIYDNSGGGAGTGTVSDFASAKGSYANGVYDTGTPWAPSSSSTKVYRFTWSLDSSTPDAKQGKTCTLAFRWEARTA
jgi:hypothetical protein